MLSKCHRSGQWVGTNEAGRVHHCSCGAHVEITPRHNPRVAGQRVEGWHARLSAHEVPHVQNVTIRAERFAEPRDLKRMAENLCAEADGKEAASDAQGLCHPVEIDLSTARRVIEGLAAAAFEIERLREALAERERTLRSIRLELARPHVSVTVG